MVIFYGTSLRTKRFDVTERQVRYPNNKWDRDKASKIADEIRVSVASNALSAVADTGHETPRCFAKPFSRCDLSYVTKRFVLRF